MMMCMNVDMHECWFSGVIFRVVGSSKLDQINVFLNMSGSEFSIQNEHFQYNASRYDYLAQSLMIRGNFREN